jgi:hypothetical protein
MIALTRVQARPNGHRPRAGRERPRNHAAQHEVMSTKTAAQEGFRRCDLHPPNGLGNRCSIPELRGPRAGDGENLGQVRRGPAQRSGRAGSQRDRASSLSARVTGTQPGRAEVDLRVRLFAGTCVPVGRRFRSSDARAQPRTPVGCSVRHEGWEWIQRLDCVAVPDEPHVPG